MPDWCLRTVDICLLEGFILKARIAGKQYEDDNFISRKADPQNSLESIGRILRTALGEYWSAVAQRQPS
jgi:hypothetical protein